jgi:alkaline phosphatase D
VLAAGATGAVAAPLAARATAAGAAAAAPPAPTPPRGRSRVFPHGVASGDPAPDGVVLWTRVTPTPASTPGSGRGPRVTVEWEVARDPAMRRVVRRGRAVTSAARDHTVKLSVTGLEPQTWYYYRFTHDGRPSRVGRTRTAPAHGADTGHLRLGFVSCANLQAGWFSAYRHLAARDDLHAVVHLGDYLYEYGSDGHGLGADDLVVRPHEPAHEIVSLADFRQRHAVYKRDRDLQDLHAAYPMIVTWDDHESANDAWRAGAGNHTPGRGDAGEGSWRVRRARAHRAYDEWMPARLDGTARLGDGTRIFRTIRFGRLAELSMLDLRSHRDEQVADLTDTAVDDPRRTITGGRQLQWLKDSLAGSPARWKLVGNPVLIAPLSLGGLPKDVAGALNLLLDGAVSPNGTPLNTDAWDGYTDDRRELFGHIADERIADVVFLTGDIHTGLAADLPLEKATYPLGGTAGVELVCASVTSNNFKDDTDTPPHTTSEVIAAALRASNPHYRYANLDDHGFCVLDVTRQRVQCDWWVIGDRADRATGVRHHASYEVRAGTGRLRRVAGPVARRG